MEEVDDIKVSMRINGKEVNIHNPPKYYYDNDAETMKITFMIGKTKLDKVELLFEKINYVDGKETTDN